MYNYNQYDLYGYANSDFEDDFDFRDNGVENGSYSRESWDVNNINIDSFIEANV